MQQFTFALVFAIFAITGQLSADETLEVDAQLTLIRDVEISAQVAGYVNEVHAVEGDDVVVGAVLASLDDELVRSELNVAREEAKAAQIATQDDVDLRYAEKTREVNKADVVRSRRANQRFPATVSESEVQRLQLTVEQAALAAEQARRDLETAQTQFAASQSSVAAAESRLKHHKVVAPSDGLVVRVDVQPGAWVNPGDTVARVIRMDVLRVEALVDGNEFGPELEGQRIVFHPAGAGDAADADQQCAGQITFVSQELHPVTGRVRIWGEIENPDRALRPGMKGKLTIARD